MITKEMFIELCYKSILDFYNENFVGKEINDAMYNVLKELILFYALVYLRFLIVIENLNIIKNNKEDWDSKSTETQDMIKTTQIGLEGIAREMENTLKLIMEGMR